LSIILLKSYQPFKPLKKVYKTMLVEAAGVDQLYVIDNM